MPAKRPEKQISKHGTCLNRCDECSFNHGYNSALENDTTFLREALPAEMDLQLFISQVLNNPTGKIEYGYIFGKKSGTFIIPPQIKTIAAAISQLYKERLGV